jgi:hypothetical protein
MQEQAFKLVPPKLASRSHVSGRHKERCRDRVLLESCLRIIEVVGVAIVKRQDNGSRIDVTSTIKSVDDLGKTSRLCVGANDLEMIMKMLLTDAQ